MAKFARLIEFDDEQVLLMVNCQNVYDTEIWVTSVMSKFHDCTGELRFGYADKESALKMMNEYTLEDAIEFRNNVVSQLSS